MARRGRKTVAFRGEKAKEPGTLRIFAIGDLHIDAPGANALAPQALAQICQALNTDMLVLLGDISHDLKRLAWGFDIMKKSASRCFFVPGNHDIWLNGDEEKKLGSTHKYLNSLNKVCEENGFKHLGLEPEIIDGIGLCGCIGWYDYSFRNPHGPTISDEEYSLKRRGRLRWMDSINARWDNQKGQPMDDNQVLDWLLKKLDKHSDYIRENGELILAFFHHLPSSHLLEWTEDAEKDYFGAFMGSDKLLGPIVKNALPGCAVCGHIHRKRYAIDRNIPCYTACLGILERDIQDPAEMILENGIFLDIS